MTTPLTPQERDDYADALTVATSCVLLQHDVAGMDETQKLRCVGAVAMLHGVNTALHNQFGIQADIVAGLILKRHELPDFLSFALSEPAGEC